MRASRPDTASRSVRRAQPLLGTLVEIGVAGCGPDAYAVLDAAFAAVRCAQACLSRFEAGSDISRFHALRSGESLLMRTPTRQVLEAARALQDASDGAFDISLGSAPRGWHCEGDRLHKLSGDTRLDLGGIGKGHAVDGAVDALLALGCGAGWVNAGGDLRAFGKAELPIRLRDEPSGGTRPFASLRDGAFATSHYDRNSRSQLFGNAVDGAVGASGRPARAHVSVAAPLCLWADALTKLIAISGNTAHPLLARFDAHAWLH